MPVFDSGWSSRAGAIPCLVLALVLAGCSGGVSSLKPAIPANVMHEGVHSGGSALAFNPPGTLLASGGWEGRVHLWSLPGGGRQAGWQAHDGTVNGLVFIDDGNVLISAGYDRRIVLWDLRGDARTDFRTESPVTSLAVAAGRGLLASGHDDGQVIVWRLRDRLGLERVGQKRLHTRRVRGLAWHPEKRCWRRAAGTAG